MERIPPDRPDMELLNASLEGDKQAWHILIHRYEKLVYSIPVKFGLPPEAAAEVFVLVWNDCYIQLKSLRHHQSVQPWLIRTAVSKTEDRLANRATEERTSHLSSKQRAELIREVEREQTVRTVIQRLNPKCRRIVEALLLHQSPPLSRRKAFRPDVAELAMRADWERCLAKFRQALTDLDCPAAGRGGRRHESAGSVMNTAIGRIGNRESHR